MQSINADDAPFLDRLTKGLDEGKSRSWILNSTTVFVSHAVLIPGYGSIYWVAQFGTRDGVLRLGNEYLKKADGKWYPVCDMRVVIKKGIPDIDYFLRYMPVCNRCRSCRVGRDNLQGKTIMGAQEQTPIFQGAIQQLRSMKMFLAQKLIESGS